MLTSLALASLLTLTPGWGDGVICSATSGGPGSEDLRALYEGGQTFPDFLEAADRRVELWHGNYQNGLDIAPDLVARARAVPGTWRFLVVAVAACSDSVSTIPYLARLVEMVEGLDMRIVDSTLGLSVMESHRTPDGRPATPTVLLLDEDYGEAGCFIERPTALQGWILDRGGELSPEQVYEQKMEWYAEDGGHATVEEFVDILEAASRGFVRCVR